MMKIQKKVERKLHPKSISKNFTKFSNLKRRIYCENSKIITNFSKKITKISIKITKF